MSTEHLAVPLSDRLDAMFGQYVAAGQSRGLVYGLTGPSGLVHAAGFGTAGDDGGAGSGTAGSGVAGDGDGAPDLDTVFPIASMTKSFVACGALLARDRGLIDLDAPITDYVGEFRAIGPAGERCAPPTVRMLLSMGGGLTEDNSWVDPFIGRPMDDLLAIVGRGLAYSNPPGVAFEYSNLGFTLAGLAVARAVGVGIEEWIRTQLLVPLGMTRTWFDNAVPEHTGAAATGYFLDEAGSWVAYPPAASDAFAAAGGMRSTVRDLATWITWLGAAFRPADGRGEGESEGEGGSDSGSGDGGDGGDGGTAARADDPVRRSSRREMQRPHQVLLPALAARADGSWQMAVGAYGLGLLVAEDLTRGTIISHSGGLPGFLLYMTWHPDSGHGIVVLTNSHRGNPIALAQDALHLVLDRHSTPARTIRLWDSTATLQRQADALIRDWDDDLADRIFAENVAFDRPLVQRRAEIAALVGEVGPLNPPVVGAAPDVVSAASPADVTWAIPAARGELICMIHLTPVQPARIQEFVVVARPAGTPRSAFPTDISDRRRATARAVHSLPNTAVVWPEGA